MASEVREITGVSMTENEYKEYINQKKEAIKNLYGDTPSGKRKSGKFWKKSRSRFSALKRDKCMSTTWEEKTQKRLEKKSVKAFEAELKQRKAEERMNNRIIAKQKKLRKLENERKAEVVQPIKNLKKLKNMKKKHIRKSNIQLR
ncbi:coiled-coil domain-containing protein 86-like [Argonauta hians]